MAKIFKFTGYYIDPDGVYTVNDVAESLGERNIDAFPHHITVKEADVGEWDDEYPLNMCDCPVAECEKYF